MFTLEHVGQGFQRTVAGTGNRTAATAVINQSIYCFLQHTFFIADNDIRRMQLQQTFQTVVTVNNTAIQIVQVGGCETTAIQLYHRTQFRRNNRNYIHNHPFRTVAGFQECFGYFQTADSTYTALTAQLLHFMAQLLCQSFQINSFQQLFNSLSPHTYTDACFRIFITFFHVLRLGQQLAFNQVSAFTRVKYDEAGKIQNFFQATRRNIQNQAHTAGDTFEVPDMGNRRSQFDVAHTVTTNLAAGNFNAALVADNTLITDAFIFAAMTFPILSRAKDSFAEQAIPFRLQGSVIDGFGFFYLAVGPGSNLVRRSQTDTHRHKIIYVDQESFAPFSYILVGSSKSPSGLSVIVKLPISAMMSPESLSSSVASLSA